MVTSLLTLLHCKKSQYKTVQLIVLNMRSALIQQVDLVCSFILENINSIVCKVVIWNTSHSTWEKLVGMIGCGRDSQTCMWAGIYTTLIQLHNENSLRKQCTCLSVVYPNNNSCWSGFTINKVMTTLKYHWNHPPQNCSRKYIINSQTNRVSNIVSSLNTMENTHFKMMQSQSGSYSK